MRHTTHRAAAAIAALGLLLSACGSDADDDDASPTSTSSEEPTTADGTTAEPTDGMTSEDTGDEDAGEAAGALTDECADALTTAGTLTVATGDVVFEPWMVDDDPTNGEGFESALVYALADELGLDTVEWTRTGFDAAIAPGDKDYDFNIQQYSITPERDEAVDFSDGYYQVEQAIIGDADGDIADAETVEDLAAYRLGAALGTTSLDYVDEVIQPTEDAQVYDDNAASKAAFDAGQVDGIVYDLPTAYFITAVEIPDASIIGVLPRADEEPEELGMLFEEGSALVPCVNDALAALRDAGTIDALEDEWLNQGGDIPTLGMGAADEEG